MKNKLLIAMAIIGFVAILSGCLAHNAAVSGSGAPFYLAYDSDEIIRDQSKVATITSTIGLEINGVEVTPANMRSANASFFKKQIVVADVLPGEYKIKATHDPSGNPIRMSEPIVYIFEAGRIYDVGIAIIKVFVKENSDTSVAQKIADNRKTAVFEKK